MSFEVCRATTERRVHDAIECEGGGVGDDGQDVVDLDTAVAVGKQGELAAHLRDASPVAADERDQESTRVGCNRQAGSAHFLVDQPGKITLAVGVAGNGRDLWPARRSCAGVRCA